MDGRGKTTLRSSQQAIQSQPCRSSGLKHKPLVALAILLLMIASFNHVALTANRWLGMWPAARPFLSSSWACSG